MNVTIIGIGSCIGAELAYRFISGACDVEGTYHRNRPDSFLLSEGDPFPNNVSVPMHECDLTNYNHLTDTAAKLSPWDVLIFASGTMEPIDRFESCDPFLWNQCVTVNTLGPLRLLRMLYPKRKPDASVVFFSGPNPDKTSPRYSAYSVSKFALLKACEELDEEWEDVKVFSIAPGIVDTKMHQQTLKAGSVRAGDNFARVTDMYSSGLPMTPHEDIYNCLRWCLDQPKSQVGGRNIHVIHDPWRGGHLRQNVHANRMRKA